MIRVFLNESDEAVQAVDARGSIRLDADLLTSGEVSHLRIQTGAESTSSIPIIPQAADEPRQGSFAQHALFYGFLIGLIIVLLAMLIVDRVEEVLEPTSIETVVPKSMETAKSASQPELPESEKFDSPKDDELTNIAAGIPTLQGQLNEGDYLEILEMGIEQASAERGKDLYAQQCAACHGSEAQGQGSFPMLAGQSSDYLYRQLYSFANSWRDNPQMQPIASALTQTQWADLSIYLAALNPTTSAEPNAVQRNDQLIMMGQQLALLGAPARGVSRCSSCHGSDGLGDGKHFPMIRGFASDYFTTALNSWKEGTRRSDWMQLMQPIAKGLTDEEVSALAAYYAIPRTSQPDAE